jgi:hypothetical protein
MDTRMLKGSAHAFAHPFIACHAADLVAG